jgi:hypothetical protein
MNTLLEKFVCSFNDLTTLDLSQNTLLENFQCRNNQLVSLDLSANTNLDYFYGNGNALTSLNIANGNNANMTWFEALDNDSLSCIQVDDAAWSTTNWTNIEAIASFSENCSGTTSTNIVDLSSAISIYPNPTTAFIQVESPINIDFIEIYGADGKLMQIVENANQIDLSTYEKGLYLLKIQTDQGIRTKKIIKQ